MYQRIDFVRNNDIAPRENHCDLPQILNELSWMAFDHDEVCQLTFFNTTLVIERA
jgi:hypothetical protein